MRAPAVVLLTALSLASAGETEAQSTSLGFIPARFGSLLVAAGAGYPSIASIHGTIEIFDRTALAGAVEWWPESALSFDAQLQGPLLGQAGYYEGSALAALGVRPFGGWSEGNWIVGSNIELPISPNDFAGLMWLGAEVEITRDLPGLGIRAGIQGVPPYSWFAPNDLSLGLTGGVWLEDGQSPRWGIGLSLVHIHEFGTVVPAPPVVRPGPFGVGAINKAWDLEGSIAAAAAGTCTSSFVSAEGDYWQGIREKRYTETFVANGGNQARNHIQGIQRAGHRIFLTGADWSAGHPDVFIADQAFEEVEVFQLPSGLPHAGGFQLQGGLMAVPFEGERKSDSSQIMFFRQDGDSLLHVKELDLQRGGPKGGAAGWTLLPDSSLLLAVWWDEPKASFLELWRRSGTAYIAIDTLTFNGTREFQSIALMNPQWKGEAQDSFSVMLVGFSNTMQRFSDRADDPGRNHVSLYELVIPDPDRADSGQTDVAFGQPSGSYYEIPLDRRLASFSAGAGLEVGPRGGLHVVAAGHYRNDGRFTFSVCRGELQVRATEALDLPAEPKANAPL